MINLDMNAVYQAEEENTPNAKPLPVGDYGAMISSSEYTQFNSGRFGVKVMLDVVTPQEYSGRKLFQNFILTEADQSTPALMGKDQKPYGLYSWAGLCKAIGLSSEDASNPDNLLMKMVTVKTKMGKDQDGNPQAEPSYYKAMPTAGTVDQGSKPAQQTQQQPGAFGQSNSSFGGGQGSSNPFAR